MHRTPITDYEKDFIRDNWETMSDLEMSNVLSRTINAVSIMRCRLKIKRYPYNRLTESGKKYIEENCLRMSDDRIGKKINVSGYTVGRYRQKIKVKKDLRIDFTNRFGNKLRQMQYLIHFCENNPNSVLLETAKYQLEKLSGL